MSRGCGIVPIQERILPDASAMVPRRAEEQPALMEGRSVAFGAMPLQPKLRGEATCSESIGGGVHSRPVDIGPQGHGSGSATSCSLLNAPGPATLAVLVGIPRLWEWRLARSGAERNG